MINSIIAFALVIYVDPLTDEKTHIAQLGQESGYSASINCGHLTNYNPALVFTMPDSIWENYNSVLTSSRLGKMRFGTDEAFAVKMNYTREKIVVQGKQKNFELIERIQSSDKMTVQLYNFREESVAVTFALDDPDRAIEQALTNCGR